MATSSTTTPRISQLADRLLEDINSRELMPGDRFLTTVEASKLLGVGSSTANRALQILERRRVIVRQQRSGAFIAGRPIAEPQPMLQRVHFLVHQKYLRMEGVGQDEVLLGIEHELPGVPVQISFLPVGGEEAFVTELVEESVRAKRVDGFVLVRASYETQRLLSQRRLPSVVYGTLYASIERLASLTADMRQLGFELTNYLLGRGHGKIAHFSRQVAYGGDQLTIQGIAAALSAAGKGFESLDVRFMPDAEEVYVAETERLLDQVDRPTGFVCRTVPMADAVRDVVESRGLVVGEDVDITVCDYYLKPGSRARYVYSNPLISSEEQGRHLARLLIAQAQNGGDEVGHEIMPIRLEAPFSTTS
jgi:GntR family transcriptional regulator, arabinose operon transcriptional repressor